MEQCAFPAFTQTRVLDGRIIPVSFSITEIGIETGGALVDLQLHPGVVPGEYVL